MIAIASDHAAIREKKRIIEHLKKRGIETKDYGAFDEKIRVDYPDYAVLVSNSILNGECDRGILLCGTGIGMSIAANKIKGIRCAHCTDTFSAKMAREHNDANIIAVGANITGCSLMLDIIDNYLLTEFSFEDRHEKRLEKIKVIESTN